MQPDHLAVVPRIRDEQHKPQRSQVAGLGRALPFDELDVREVRLSFDQHTAGVDRNHRVAAPPIARERNRDLDAKAGGGTEPRPQPRDQRKVRPIPDRVAIREELSREAQAHGGRQARGKVQRERAIVPGLGAGDALRAGPDPAAQLPATQTDSAPRDGELLADPVTDCPAPTLADGCGRLGLRHRRMVKRRGSPPIICA
ncbi:MAG TPA: hypothetical protein VM451_06770 [Candidatus Limnocylindria bacterium]|nr:hypothetical protein [Candidatus Limnocylindria bacterium]